MTLSPRKLNSDQLGQKGEARFRELCSDAKLVCNKAELDRNGWDFIVEFPFDPVASTVPLDMRQAPLSCHVQVKTMWNDNNGFSVRLSSAERLAKDPKPTFFYVLKVNQDLAIVEAFLIPIVDDTFARVLKRLRLETAKGPSSGIDLNKKTLNFVVPPDRSIAPTGRDLREALHAACAPDPETSIRRKAEQFRTLGFESAPYEATTTIVLEDKDEIADIFLGVKPAKVSELKTFETRFGIKLLQENHSGGQATLHIQPHPIDCTLIIKGENQTMPATFSADLIMPPVWLESSQAKFLVRAKLFEMEIRQRGMNFSTKPEAFQTLAPAKEWINLFRLLAILSHGAATLGLVCTRLPPINIPIKLENPPNRGENESILKVFQSAEKLFGLAGIEAPLMIPDDILRIGSRIISVAELFSDPSSAPDLTFRTELPENREIPGPMDALYVDAIDIAGVTLAFSSVARMIPQAGEDEIQWSLQSMKPREIAPVRNYLEDYKRFADRSKSETNITTIIMATYDGVEKAD
jgi:hypothetical protein